MQRLNCQMLLYCVFIRFPVTYVQSWWKHAEFTLNVSISLERPSGRRDWYNSSCMVGRKFKIIYLYLLSHPSRLLMGTLHLPLHAVSEIGGVENCWIVLLKYDKLDCYWTDFWFFWNRAYIFFGLGGFLGIEKNTLCHESISNTPRNILVYYLCKLIEKWWRSVLLNWKLKIGLPY